MRDKGIIDAFIVEISNSLIMYKCMERSSGIGKHSRLEDILDMPCACVLCIRGSIHISYLVCMDSLRSQLHSDVTVFFIYVVVIQRGF